MGSELNQASNVNKWYCIGRCKDGTPNNYHCRISLNKTVRGMDGKIGNNTKILFTALFSPLFWIRYFPMDSASTKNELSERYPETQLWSHTAQ